jgi:predicted PurR-regulated permease PerM
MFGVIRELLGPRSGATSVGIVPVWLDRTAQWSWRILVVLGTLSALIFLIGQASFLVVPVILAAVLAPTFLPVVRWLETRGLQPAPAALVAVVGAAVVTVIALWLTLSALAGAAADIGQQAEAGATELSDAAAGLLGFVGAIVQRVGQEVGGITTWLVAGAVVGVIFVGATSLVLTYYLLRDGARGWQVATSRLSPWRRRRLDTAGERSVGVLGGYMFGTAIISGFGAITQWALMVILGLPLALPLAVLSFFGGFIPYIGGFITTGLAFLVTLAVGEPIDILVMGAFTIVFNIVQGNILAPLVYGRVASLHPAVVLLAIPAGGAIAGILGMFLVVPFLGVVAVSWRSVLEAFGDADVATVEPAEAAPGPDARPEPRSVTTPSTGS